MHPTFMGQQLNQVNPIHVERFWQISRSFEGISGEIIRTGQALKDLSTIIRETPKETTLWRNAYLLQQQIIFQEAQLQSPVTPGTTTATIFAFPIKKA